MKEETNQLMNECLDMFPISESVPWHFQAYVILYYYLSPQKLSTMGAKTNQWMNQLIQPTNKLAL